MPIQPVRHISVGISRPLDEVYAFLSKPENFPQWASGLGKSLRHVEGLEWIVETSEGPLRVHFSAQNAFGILDHSVIMDGAVVHNPMRVFANGDGSEVLFTLLRRPGVSDTDFEQDAASITRDLQRLKALLED